MRTVQVHPLMHCKQGSYWVSQRHSECPGELPPEREYASAVKAWCTTEGRGNNMLTYVIQGRLLFVKEVEVNPWRKRPYSTWKRLQHDSPTG